MREQRIKTICIILCIVMAVIIVIICVNNERQDQKYNLAWQKYEEETLDYRTEAYELEKELESMSEEIVYYGEKANFMIGFAATDISDISFIQQQAKQYGFKPILVLDATMDISNIKTLVRAAEKQWEIMLHIPAFTDESNEKILSTKSYLESIQRKDCGVAFCRVESVADDDRAMLNEAGFIGYTLYHDSPISGQAEDGKIYFDYARIASDGVSIEERLSQCYSQKSSSIYVFDMESIRFGDLSESGVTESLEVLIEYSAKEDCEIITVAEVVGELSKINQKKAEMEAYHENRIEEIQERMEELDQIITEIHNKYFDEIS